VWSKLKGYFYENISHWFFPAAIALAAASFAAFGTVPPAHAKTAAKTPTQARYVSKGGFSFAVPAKWHKDDADISMERMRYTVDTTDGRVVASLKISTLRDKDATPDSLAEHLREIVKGNTGTIIIVRDKAVTVSQQPGIIFETNNTRPSEPDTEMTLLTARNWVTSRVILTCKTADRAKYGPVFDKVVATFKWQ